MKLEEFNLLDTSAKSDVLFSNGHQIASDKISEQGYFLFKIYDHYAEVQFDFNKGKITKIFAFENGNKLDKYLNKQNVSR